MKNALLAPLALLSICTCSTAWADPDPWFGRDKALHFGVSAALAAGGYAASSPWLDSRAERTLAGSAFSLSLGAGKELWDLSGHGDPSWRDFTWDVVGTAVGVALALGIDSLTSPKREATQSTAHGLVFHF